MRAALYARVSTDEQAEKYGLSSQLTELRELAAKKGFTVPKARSSWTTGTQALPSTGPP